MIFLLLSCYPKPYAQERGSPYFIGDAQIINVDTSCDDDKWTIEVFTDAWTSNGTLWLARDLSRYEKHPINSIAATEDGTSDHLRVNLDITAEWQNFTPGESTGWLCSESSDISIAIVIYHGENQQPNDCIYWGEDIWGDFPNVDECDVWVFED
jgi:hypothetical protein